MVQASNMNKSKSNFLTLIKVINQPKKQLNQAYLYLYDFRTISILVAWDLQDAKEKLTQKIKNSINTFCKDQLIITKLYTKDFSQTVFTKYFARRTLK